MASGCSRSCRGGRALQPPLLGTGPGGPHEDPPLPSLPADTAGVTGPRAASAWKPLGHKHPPSQQHGKDPTLPQFILRRGSLGCHEPRSPSKPRGGAAATSQARAFAGATKRPEPSSGVVSAHPPLYRCLAFLLLIKHFAGRQPQKGFRTGIHGNNRTFPSNTHINFSKPLLAVPAKEV